MLVLLDSLLEASCQHLEKIRSLVNALQVRFKEQLLGRMTLSVGIVETLRHNLTADELQRVVDGA
jgi:PleD family two-component response regulator